MKDGEPCTLRGVSTVLEGVTPRPLTKGSTAWRFLPYELYTMQRYLQYGKLNRMGLGHFDSWASTFGEVVTSIELAPEGTGYRAKSRFA
ncbi:MAG: helicase, partial [Erysipelotrichaceae bacterium]|nr:helicase [Erysipelotrichaceae bacterium]